MKDLNKIILKNVENSLAELDVDGMVNEMISKKAVKEIVERMLKEKIALVFQEKVLLKYKKQERQKDSPINIKKSYHCS